jgi:hypothetical protein
MLRAAFICESRYIFADWHTRVVCSRPDSNTTRARTSVRCEGCIGGYTSALVRACVVGRCMFRTSLWETLAGRAARRNQYDAVLMLLGGHLHPLDDQTTAVIMHAVKSRNNRGKSPYGVSKSETVRRVIKLAEGGQLPRVRPSWSAPSSPVHSSNTSFRRRTMVGEQSVAGVDPKRILLKSKTSMNFCLENSNSRSPDADPASVHRTASFI